MNQKFIDIPNLNKSILKAASSLVMRLSIISACALAGATLCSCDKSIAWSESLTLPKEGWDSSAPADFNIDPAAYARPQGHSRFAEATNRAIGDTLPRLNGVFTATLSLRYTDECPLREVRLQIERASLRDEIHTDTIAMPLYDDRGHNLGRGRFGIYETSARLPRPLRVNEGTILSVTPIGIPSPTPGLASITLTLNR
jgi:hypothetical protein